MSAKGDRVDFTNRVRSISRVSVPWGSKRGLSLSGGPQELCARFASSGTDKFAGLALRTSPSGNPLLPGVAPWLDCRVEEIRKLRDHHFALARVTALDGTAATTSIVFHRGALHALPRDRGAQGRAGPEEAAAVPTASARWAERRTVGLSPSGRGYTVGAVRAPRKVAHGPGRSAPARRPPPLRAR
ncbi:flavin reductase family protein [Streptomyces sp. NPDC088812]|uniref:flavin reductase family protein n=1 Tax=Streptomyces sp. NPDC088812 TaxID=3365905 RepID=UPI00382658E4